MLHRNTPVGKCARFQRVGGDQLARRGRTGRTNCCTTEPLVCLRAPAISAKSAAKPTWPTGWNAMATVSVKPDVMLHHFKQFSNHLIASQLQQRLAASSRPQSRPTDAWCRCAQYRLYPVATQESRLEMPTATNIFGPKLVPKNVERINRFPVIVQAKADGVFPSSCREVWQNPLTYGTL